MRRQKLNELTASQRESLSVELVICAPLVKKVDMFLRLTCEFSILRFQYPRKVRPSHSKRLLFTYSTGLYGTERVPVPIHLPSFGETACSTPRQTWSSGFL
jgi:hypothetical protein